MRSASRIGLPGALGPLSAVLAVWLSGCCSAPCYSPRTSRTHANLVLGPSPEVARSAERFGPRTLVPDAIIGYRVDSYSTSTTILFDDQSFYDRMGGGVFHGAVSERSETWLR